MKKFMKWTLCVILAVSMIAFAAACKKNKDPDVYYTLTYQTGAGDDIASVQLKEGDALVLPENPTCESDLFRFHGWYLDAGFVVPFAVDTMPAKDITVYARWVGANSSVITFHTNGGDAVADIVAPVGTTIVAPQDPAKDGYRFDGWYTDASLSTAFTFTTMPEEDITLHAKWKDNDGKVYVTFYVNGEEVKEINVDEGTAIANAPEGLIPQGLASDGWYSDKIFISKFNFNKTLTKDTSVYANAYTEGLKVSGNAIVGYDGTATDVIVSSTVQGKEIKEIGDRAFYGNTTLTSVKLPTSVTKIGAHAFYNCEYLDNCRLPAGVTTVGEYAFYKCRRLQSVGTISATSIGNGAFMGCLVLSDVAVSNKLQTVGANAFNGCAKITNLTFTDNLTAIGEFAFAGCESLKSLYIGDKMNALGDGALDGCNSNMEVEVNASNIKFSVRDGNLFDKAGSTLIKYFTADKNETEYVIPVAVRAVRANAFSGNAKLEKVVLHDKMREVTRGMLFGMRNLKEVVLPYLGNGNDEIYLAYVFGADSAKENGIAGRYVPSTLNRVELLTKLDAIPDYAFYGCTGLRELVGAEEVTAVGNYAFAYTGLETITIPQEVETIADTAFYGCEYLTEINVEDGNATYQSKNGLVYSKNGLRLLMVPAELQDITIDENARTIVTNAFISSTAKEITIPETITLIENGALTDCNYLQSLRLPFIGEKATEPGAYTEQNHLHWLFGATKTITTKTEEGVTTWSASFSSTVLTPQSLKTVELYREGITEIPAYAFFLATGLQEVEFPATVTKIGKRAFTGVGFREIVVPASVTEIEERAYAECTSATSVKVLGPVTKMGEMAFAFLVACQKVEFAEGVKIIGEAAVYPYATMDTLGSLMYESVLTEIIIPDSVEEIGKMAFAYAAYTTSTGLYYQMTNVQIGANPATSKLKTIKSGAFYRSGVQHVQLPASLEVVEGDAFNACQVLQSVTIGTAAAGSNLKEIGALGFAQAQYLTSVTIHKQVTKVEDVPTLGAFELEGTNYYPFVVPTSTMLDATNVLIYVPKNSVEFYQAAESWQTYALRVKAIME